MAAFQNEVDALLVAIFESIATKGSVLLIGGAAGSVDSIAVDAVEVMSGAEAFDTDLATTAANVADNINAHTSVPNYEAKANGAEVLIIANDGVVADTFAVVSGATTITTTDANISAGSGTLSQELASNPNIANRDRNLAQNFAMEFFQGVKDTTQFNGSTIANQFIGNVNEYLNKASRAT